MGQEQKDLLLKDLCARLPYGVKILYKGWDSDGGCEFTTVETLIGIDDRFIYTLWRDEKYKHSIVEPLSITDYRPYLFPMSSMTARQREEERHLKEELYSFDADGNVFTLQDFYNKNHIDFRGLIPTGLALDATELNIY